MGYTLFFDTISAICLFMHESKEKTILSFFAVPIPAILVALTFNWPHWNCVVAFLWWCIFFSYCSSCPMNDKWCISFLRTHQTKSPYYWSSFQLIVDFYQFINNLYKFNTNWSSTFWCVLMIHSDFLFLVSSCFCELPPVLFLWDNFN